MSNVTTVAFDLAKNTFIDTRCASSPGVAHRKDLIDARHGAPVQRIRTGALCRQRLR
jgi:hypothetical protein